MFNQEIPTGFKAPVLADALSCVLENINLKATRLGHLRARTPWGIGFNEGSMGFFLIARGNCWIKVGQQEPIELCEGDIAILAKGLCCELMDRPGRATVGVADFKQASDEGGEHGPMSAGEGARVFYGGFVNEQQMNSSLFEVLPDVIHIRAGHDKFAGWLGETMKFLLLESETERPGVSAIISRLAQVVFVQAVRMCVARSSEIKASWLAALGNADIGPVLSQIHSHPEKPWTVESLAEEAGMSRSVFAAKFATATGKGPMQYVFECRMEKVSKLLGGTKFGLKEIASVTGYGSQAALSTAFKRWAGTAPATYRQKHRKLPVNIQAALP